MPEISLERRTATEKDLMKRSKEELIKLILAQRDIQIPASIFSEQLPPLTALVIYLNKNYKLKASDIANRLNRHPQTIWTTIRLASNKKIQNTHSEYTIPLIRFSKEKFSILETLVAYLQNNYGLTISEISRLLNKNIKTIWTCKSRFITKGGKI